LQDNPFRILLKQEMMRWQWQQLDHMQIICNSLQANNHASTSSHNVYSPDARPDLMPNQQHQSTEALQAFFIAK